MRAVRTHIEGLKKMVAMRGGFEKLRSSSPITASVAFWCVASVCIFTDAFASSI